MEVSILFCVCFSLSVPPCLCTSHVIVCHLLLGPLCDHDLPDGKTTLLPLAELVQKVAAELKIAVREKEKNVQNRNCKCAGGGRKKYGLGVCM